MAMMMVIDEKHSLGVGVADDAYMDEWMWMDCIYLF